MMAAVSCGGAPSPQAIPSSGPVFTTARPTLSQAARDFFRIRPTAAQPIPFPHKTHIAKQAMCTRELGADQLFVWPGVELAVMGAEGAVNVLYRREIDSAPDPAEMRRQKIAEFSERFSGPFDALAKQFAHAVIRPPETRARIIRALRLLATKREERPRKKHSVMPV